MEHKAFVFDYYAFRNELAEPLYFSLLNRKRERLSSFINLNLSALSDPYEGEPLGEDWREQMETGDEQEMGDFALTKFYAPERDVGLGAEWQEAQRLLGSQGTTILLGGAFGPPDNYFDPGRMGAYFQSPEQVEINLSSLDEFICRNGDVALLERVNEMLKSAILKRRGLFVTF